MSFFFCFQFFKINLDEKLIWALLYFFLSKFKILYRYPEPEVEWYRNNERLYPSERIKMERETTGLLRLTVAHIDPDVDVAKYKLRIYNDHGEDECTASFIYDSE